MGISVEGQKCPICGGYVFDEDDLVFCPVCGAPHHRDCYKNIGKCGLEELHGTDKEYKRPTEKKTFEESKKEPFKKSSEGSDSVLGGGNVKYKLVCPNCMNEYESGQDNCPNCGAPAPLMFTPFGTPLSINPLGGVPESARLEDGTSAKEVALYTAVNTPRYVKKFFTLGIKNRLSWNWAAFLFPNSWFFYRKIYFPGVMFFVLTALSGVMTMAINLAFGGMAFTSSTEMATYLAQNLGAIDKAPLLIAFAGSFLNFIIRIIAGLFGDWIYRKDALEKIKLAKGNTQWEENENIRIHKKGGVSAILGIVGLFALQWVEMFIFGLL